MKSGPKLKRMAIQVGGGPAPGINGVIAAATIEALHHQVEVFGMRDGNQWIMKGVDAIDQALGFRAVAGPRFSCLGEGETLQVHQAARNRQRHLYPLQRRLDAGHLAGQSNQRSRSHGQRARRLSQARHRRPGFDRRRRYGVFREPGLQERGGHDPRRPRAQDDRQRFAAARLDADVRLRYGPAARRRAGPQPRRGRPHHVALVHHHQHGPGGGPSRARHRQGVGQHAHDHPRGIRGQRKSRSIACATSSSAPSSSASRSVAAMAWPCSPRA